MTDERQYIGLEVTSDPPEPPAPEGRCARVRHSVWSVTSKATRYMVNAFALTLGATVGCYTAWMLMSQVAPIAVTINIKAILPGPD